MNENCGCCEGTEKLTPVTIANRPGLSALAYRVGIHGSFLETMKARLSNMGITHADMGLPLDKPDEQDMPTYPLQGLTTRSADDPAIAMLDAWATVADVLTFYQERIANEGYLRTATERRSVLELARLVGYRLRPGVAASVYLAYTLDQNSETTIPAGSRAQSLPAQGELPQSFETSAPLLARGAWNNLTPRLTQPQMITADATEIYLAGTNANLKPDDPILIFSSPGSLRRIKTVETNFQNSRTKVTLQSLAKDRQTEKPQSETPLHEKSASFSSPFVSAVKLVAPHAPLIRPPADHPANSVKLPRSVSQSFKAQADTTPALLKTFHPGVGQTLYTALENASVTPVPSVEVHAFRVQAAPFGNNAPLKPITNDKGVVVATEEWPLVGSAIVDIVVPHNGILDRAKIFSGESSSDKPSVSIQVGQDKGSATYSISQPSQDLEVGPWKVKVTQHDGITEFDFPAPLSSKVAVVFGDGTVKVTIKPGTK